MHFSGFTLVRKSDYIYKTLKCQKSLSMQSLIALCMLKRYRHKILHIDQRQAVYFFEGV